MRKTVVFRLIPLFFLAVSFVPAAMEPPSLPQDVFLHVSVKSPAALFSGLDKAAVTIARGTRNELPPGMLPMLLQLYLPFPMEALDMDAPADLVVLGAGSPTGFAVLARAESLESVVKSLEDEDIDVDKFGGPDDKAGGSDLYWVRSGRMDLYLGEAGGGRMFFTDAFSSIGRILEISGGLPRDFQGGGVAAVRVNLPDGWADEGVEDILDSLDEISATLRDGDSGRLENLGVDPDMARALLGLYTRYLPPVLDEVAAIEDVFAEIRLDGARLGLSVSPGFPDGSFASLAAGTIEKGTRVDSPMLKHVGRDAAAVGVTSSLADVVPDAFSRIRDAAEVFFAAALPGQREAALEVLRESEAAGAGESVSAGYHDSGSRYNVVWMRVKDAAKYMSASRKSVEIVNAFLGEFIRNPSFRFSFSRERVAAPAGVECLKFVLTPDEPESVEKFLAALDLDDVGQPVIDAVRRVLASSLFVAAKGNVVVVVYGEAGEDELLRALSAMDSAGGEFMDADAAREALADLDFSQTAFGLADFDAALFDVALEMAQTRDRLSSSRVSTEKILHSMRPDLAVSGEMIGFALGAADGRLFMDMSIPLDSVNAALRNYERFHKLLSERERDEEDEPEYEGGGEEEEKEEEPMDGEESPQFDEPVGAS